MMRRFRPAMDGMERRELLSGLAAALASRHAALHASAAAGNGGSGGSGSGGSQGGGGSAVAVNGPNGTTLTTGAPNQYLQPTGTPARHERARQAFAFKFAGAFVQGPGRYSDEATLVHVKGVGSSTFFLHGDIQIGAITPTDPARPTSGAATSFDRNINANSVFGLDMTGSTADVDAAGRPTHFTAATDTNLSAGIFAEAPSTATVDIKYFPDGKAHPKGFSAGRATVVIRGFVYSLGVANIEGSPLSRKNTTRPGSVRV